MSMPINTRYKEIHSAVLWDYLLKTQMNPLKIELNKKVIFDNDLRSKSTYDLALINFQIPLKQIQIYISNQSQYQ